MFSVHRYHEIRAIVGAEVVSSIGSSMTVLALPWFVLVTTGSATKLGLVLGIGSIPFVTLPVLAGSLIARIGARQTMVIADGRDFRCLPRFRRSTASTRCRSRCWSCWLLPRTCSRRRTCLRSA